MNEEKHIFTMLVDNEPGVLSRVVGLFSGRGFNIDSLVVAETMDPKVSRITIVTKADKPVQGRRRRSGALHHRGHR
jgi:acetolactate synthase-1/3 small subunit